VSADSSRELLWPAEIGGWHATAASLAQRFHRSAGALGTYFVIDVMERPIYVQAHVGDVVHAEAVSDQFLGDEVAASRPAKTRSRHPTAQPTPAVRRGRSAVRGGLSTGVMNAVHTFLAAIDLPLDHQSAGSPSGGSGRRGSHASAAAPNGSALATSGRASGVTRPP
jgi:hypothetical protein